MRSLVALVCCAAFLTFGVVSDAAHIHDSADHHAEAGGLHFDHAHLHGATDHDTHHGHGHHHPHPEPSSEPSDDPQFDARHAPHHHGDALYLSATALRTSDSSLRSMPATVAVGPLIGPPTATAVHDPGGSGPSRAPPRRDSIRPRAPPA
jgi:hypothetical protein